MAAVAVGQWDSYGDWFSAGLFVTKLVLGNRMSVPEEEKGFFQSSERTLFCHNFSYSGIVFNCKYF